MKGCAGFQRVTHLNHEGKGGGWERLGTKRDETATRRSKEKRFENLETRS